MQSTSINEKGDMAYLFQTNKKNSFLCIYNDIANTLQTIELPSFDLIALESKEDYKHYYQLACALSPDSSTVVCIGKIDQEMKIIVVDVKTAKFFIYDKQEFQEYPLFATFSADGNKVCIISGNFVYIVDTQNYTQKPIKKEMPHTPIEYLFSHLYDNIPYLIIKAAATPAQVEKKEERVVPAEVEEEERAAPAQIEEEERAVPAEAEGKKDQLLYNTLNLNTLLEWENRKKLEDFDFNDIIKSAKYKNEHYINEYFQNENFLISKDAFNFYTYQMRPFTEQLNTSIINIVPEDIRNVIKEFNIKQIRLIDALYLLAFKIQKWDQSISSILKIKYLFFGKVISSYIKTCTDISTRSIPPIHYIVSKYSKLTLLKEHLSFMSLPYQWAIPALGASLFISPWLSLKTSSAFLGALALGIGHFSEYMRESRSVIDFTDPKTQTLHNMLKYLRYGLGSAATLGLGWLALKYYRQ